jgi:hypothetical protein
VRAISWLAGMEDADLFIDDIDGIFDDDEDDDEGQLTDDEGHGSFGDDSDHAHDSSMAVATCSSFPMMMDGDGDGDGDGENDEEGHHLMDRIDNSAGSTSENLVASSAASTETRLNSPSVDTSIHGVAGQDQVHHVKQQAIHVLGHDSGQGDDASRTSDLARDSARLTTGAIPRPDSSTAVGAPAIALPSSASRRRSVSEPGAANPKHKTMRRSGKHLEAQVCPLPPPSWHSEAADRHHRQAMILEMYVLLQVAASRLMGFRASWKPLLALLCLVAFVYVDSTNECSISSSAF